MTIDTINPATGKLIKAYPEMSLKETAAIIDSTHQAYLSWRKTSFAERSRLLNKAAEVLEKNQQHYASLISQEMGKPLAAALGEIKKCMWVCRYYAENAEGFLQDEIIKTEMAKSYVSYRPRGIVFAIMPWNFPFWQVFRFACPTLMAGNAGLLKHAPISTGTALAIESVFVEAGYPKDLFRSLILDNEGAAAVINNKKVTACTLTGSAGAGRVVGATAAKALKKIVLELGGSDPYVILADADIEQAAETCVTSRMNNSGQVCISAKRLIVVDKVYDQFKAAVLSRLDRFVMGDPMDPNVNFGPLAREDIRDQVHAQVQASVAGGATLLLGGEVPKREGFYYPPTALEGVKPGMVAFDDEIFGPVIAFVRAKDEAEALTLANQSPFGLGAAVFTQDLAKGEHIARDVLEAGTCCVNTLVGSDPRLPFGGIGESGYGRELSRDGIREFVNIKTVCIK